MVVNLHGHRVTGRETIDGDDRDIMTNLGDSLSQGTQHPSVIMPWNNLRLKSDIVRIISQWLADEGFGATRQSLLEEAGICLLYTSDAADE